MRWQRQSQMRIICNWKRKELFNQNNAVSNSEVWRLSVLTHLAIFGASDKGEGGQLHRCGGDTALMKTMEIRCYAEGRDAGWEAICLDLDIAVQGHTFEEVYHLLNDAVREYVEYVATLPADEQRRLLSRRAPLFDRLRFAWHALMSTFRNDGPDGKQRHEYTRPLVFA